MMDRITKSSTPPPTDEFTNAQLNTPVADKLPATPQKQRNVPGHQLLTPPSTEKSGRTVRFALDQRSPTLNRRRLVLTEKEDEAALSQGLELAGPIPFGDTSVSEGVWSDEESSSLYSRLQSNPNGEPGGAKHRMFLRRTGLVPTSTPTTPFPFTKLPLSVRKKVYKTLLVVPGLICVRQNHTSYHKEEKAYLYAETRQLLPGIAYALPQVAVNGFKIRFSRFPLVNATILRVSKEVYNEAKSVMYGGNEFEIVCPNLETSPPPDYKVRLFPRGCQGHVQSLSIRVRAFYPLKWLLNGGYSKIKRAYPGLGTLTIILEMESGNKDLGKVLGKRGDERWGAYVTRLHAKMTVELFGSKNDIKNLPVWLNLRILFPGELYSDHSEPTAYNIKGDLGPDNADPTDAAEERLKRFHLKRGLAEVFEMFKKGGH